MAAAERESAAARRQRGCARRRRRGRRRHAHAGRHRVVPRSGCQPGPVRVESQRRHRGPVPRQVQEEPARGRGPQPDRVVLRRVRQVRRVRVAACGRDPRPVRAEGQGPNRRAVACAPREEAKGVAALAAVADADADATDATAAGGCDLAEGRGVPNSHRAIVTPCGEKSASRSPSRMIGDSVHVSAQTRQFALRVDCTAAIARTGNFALELRIWQMPESY